MDVMIGGKIFIQHEKRLAQANVRRYVSPNGAALAATTEGTEVMAVIETRTKKTFDSWGFEGIATYHRLSAFNHAGWAYVRMSDTSTGHGWAGPMHVSDWDKLQS